jgi:hypothetical protein
MLIWSKYWFNYKDLCHISITFFNILLHVWGFLGNVAWALSRNNAVVHCYIFLATQQFKRKAYQQNCCARDNSHEDVSMVTGWSSMDFYWYRHSGFEIARVETCVCIWLRTPVGLRSDLVFRDRPGWTCTFVQRVVDLCLRVSCVRGPEEIGRTRLVRRAIDCN